MLYKFIILEDIVEFIKAAYIIIIFLYIAGCDPRAEALIANRSGSDIVVYVDGKSEAFLFDGYDDTYRPLKSVYFKENGNIYIAICPRNDFFNDKCKNAKKINYGKIKNMVVALEKYKKNNKTYATYILDHNFDLNLSKYNGIKHMPYRRNKNGNLFLVIDGEDPMLIKE